MYKLEGRHDGRRIIIPIQILVPAPEHDLTATAANALLDTGATNSGITPIIIEKLGLQSIGKRPLGSARAEEQVPRYLFRVGLEMTASERRFPFIFDAIDGFELRNSVHFDALIGMDILRQCNFEMRHDGGWSLAFGM